MTDKQRILRLEYIVGTLIQWLHMELGTDNARSLIKLLENEPPKK